MALTGKRILITGGAGFIGSHLVERLLGANDVVVYDNLHRNALQFVHLDEHPRLHFIKGDVLDYQATRAAMEGCQVVIHCAAIAGVYTVDRSAIRTMEVNLLGTNQVVKAAIDVRVERFVEFSTSEVYGPFIHKGKEDDLVDDRSGRREPLGVRSEQAGFRAPVIRPLQGRQAAARHHPAVQRVRPAAGW